MTYRRPLSLLQPIDQRGLRDPAKNFSMESWVSDISGEPKRFIYNLGKENVITKLGFLGLQANSYLGKAEKGYNPFDDGQLDMYQDYMQYFIHSRSRIETRDLIKDFHMDQQMYKATPAMIAGMLTGALTDPTSIFMFMKAGKWFWKGSTLAKTGKFGGALTAEEMIKQVTDTTRHKEMAMFTAGVGFGLPLVLGSLKFAKNIPYKSFKKYEELDRSYYAVKAMRKKINEETMNPLGGVGAHYSPGVKIQSLDELLNDKSFTETWLGKWGIENLPANPIWRVIKSPVLEAREMVLSFLESPLYLKENEKFISSIIPIDNIVGQRMTVVTTFIRESEEFYIEYLKSMGVRLRTGGKMVKIHIAHLGKPDVISFRQFRKAITRGMMKGGKSENEFIQKGIDSANKNIYTPIGKELEESGIRIWWIDREITKWEMYLGFAKSSKKGYLEMGPDEFNKIEVTIADIEGILKNLNTRKTYLVENGPLRKDYVNSMANYDAIHKKPERFAEIMRAELIKKNPKITDVEIRSIIEDWMEPTNHHKYPNIAGSTDPEMMFVHGILDEMGINKKTFELKMILKRIKKEELLNYQKLVDGGLPIANVEMLKELDKYYIITRSAEKSTKKQPLSKQSEELLKDLDKNWEAFSRSRGYTEKQISDFAIWLQVSAKAEAQLGRNFIISRIKQLDDALKKGTISLEDLKAAKKLKKEIKLTKEEKQKREKIFKTDFGRISRNFKSRELNINYEKLMDEGFIEDDIFRLSRAYFNSTVPDLEISKVFGDPMAWGDKAGFRTGLKGVIEKYNDLIKNAKTDKQKAKLLKQKGKDLHDLQASRDLDKGLYGIPENPHSFVSKAVRGTKMFNTWNMLTGWGAAVPDVGRIIMANGIDKLFKDSWSLMTSGMWDHIVKLNTRDLRLIHEGVDMEMGTRAAMINDIDTPYGMYSNIEKGMNSFTNFYFTWINGMNIWNTGVKRVLGLVNGSTLIEDMSHIVHQTGKKSSMFKTDRTITMRLGNAFIDEAMAERIIFQFEEYGFQKGSLHVANFSEWTDPIAKHHFASALKHESNIGIVTPRKGDMPLWMNWRFGGMFAQFKKFGMAATQAVLIRGMQERDANFFMGMMFLVALGAVVDMVRTRAFNKDYSKKSTQSQVLDALDRSAAIGIFTDINRAIESSTDNRFGLRPLMGDKKPYGTSWKYKTGILGPTASQVSNIADIMYDTGTGQYDHWTARNVRRLIPFQNVFYLDWLFDKIEKGLRF